MSLEEKKILGVPTFPVAAGGAVRILDAAIEARKPAKVGFLNAHMAMLAQGDAAYCAILQNFIIFNDGIGIDIASWLKYGTTYADNLNGTDFVPLYLAQTTHALRIFLFGGKPDVVSDATQAFAKKFPRHQIVGTHDGYSARDGLVEKVKASQANLILVALGNPFQEKWIEENLAASGAMIAMGVGGLFDFTAERLPRAPELLRDLRCEWIFRFYCEPQRLWKRYTVEVVQFLFCATQDAIRYRFRK